VSNSYQGSHLSSETITRDHEIIEKRLLKARQLTPPSYVNAITYHPEYFPIYDIAGTCLKEKGLIINWQAHLIGLRHKTTNVLLITEQGKLITQQRAHDTILFPSRYTVSAGGHLSQKTLNQSTEIDPLQTIVHETAEELNLKIDTSRFQPLGDAKIGIPNFLNVWIYRNQEHGIVATISVFDEEATLIGIDVQKGHITPDKRNYLTKIIREESKGNLPEEELMANDIALFTRNIELCHFYTVVISSQEQQKIHFVDKEVAGYKLVDVQELIRAGKDLDTATDSLYILFSDESIIEQLERRTAQAKYK